MYRSRIPTCRKGSLPAREEWIEILLSDCQAPAPQSLFPRGKSGLKSEPESFLIRRKKSLPAREEWIEILLEQGEQVSGQSLPAREEWIEILFLSAICGRDAGLFPRGKSGLKFLNLLT